MLFHGAQHEPLQAMVPPAGYNSLHLIERVVYLNCATFINSSYRSLIKVVFRNGKTFGLEGNSRESSLLKSWNLVPGARAIFSRKILSLVLGLFKSHVTIGICIYWVLHSHSRLDNSICFYLAKRSCTLMLRRRWKREIYIPSHSECILKKGPASNHGKTLL